MQKGPTTKYFRFFSPIGPHHFRFAVPTQAFLTIYKGERDKNIAIPEDRVVKRICLSDPLRYCL